MRKYFLIYFVAGLAVFIISCKPTFRIQSENILDRDFSRFESYKFFNPESLPASNFSFSDKNKKRIYDSVAEEMNRRGYKSIQQADLIIKIQGGTSHEIENRRPTYYDPYSNYGYYGYPYSWSRDPWMYDDISKKTTMLIIDVLDAGSKQLLWQGTGYGVLSDKAEMVEINLRQAIADIFSQFPVQPQPKQ
ncbi:MAG: DUF4136 domain-containing protein [Cyclobacteriaceae bacterium]|nr:DUF4136 domain-containing protein [Cyclobacteriaceae bacterium]